VLVSCTSYTSSGWINAPLFQSRIKHNRYIVGSFSYPSSLDIQFSMRILRPPRTTVDVGGTKLALLWPDEDDALGRKVEIRVIKWLLIRSRRGRYHKQRFRVQLVLPLCFVIDMVIGQLLLLSLRVKTWFICGRIRRRGRCVSGK